MSGGENKSQRKEEKRWGWWEGGGQGEIEGGEVTDGWAQTGNDIYDFAGQCGFY